ncbi:MAG: nitroreductase family protein, partial [Chloroflexi bacterium]|nr:nitroreductase family protein [Chloroflexota bacterium]
MPKSLQENAALRIILARRSVRSFSSVEIPADAWDAILEAGRVAPSTVNLQSWSFALFDRVSWRKAFGAALPFNAQRAIIILADGHRARQVIQAFPESPLVEYTIAVMNASLAAMNMNVAAEALGISSVMLSETGRAGLLDIAWLRDKLALPAGVIPLMTIVFGYARGGYPPMPPKLPNEMLCFTESYHEADTEQLEEWYREMVAGYNSSHLGTTFQKQLDVYKSKIGAAENELRKSVLG